jgi:mRNA interferase MazF
MFKNLSVRLGEVVMCDYGVGFRAPEMVKNRPVVVVSRPKAGLVIVVPLSTSESSPPDPSHVELQKESLPQSLRAERCWAKCDMLGCVALDRLDRVVNGRCPTTHRRIFVNHAVTPGDFMSIRRAVQSILLLVQN